MQPPINPSIVPPQLLARWSGTRPLIAVVGLLGVLSSVLLAGGAVALGLLFFPVPAGVAVAGIVFFLSSIAFMPSFVLLRQSGAIERAVARRTPDAAAEVLAQQIRYWRFFCIWTAVSIAIVFAMLLWALVRA